MAIDKNWKFLACTKDDEEEDIERVSVQLLLPYIDPMRHMDTSTHTLETIDTQLTQLTNAQAAMMNQYEWWTVLRARVLEEAQKVKLKPKP